MIYNYKIGIIGLGFVGEAIQQAYSEHYPFQLVLIDIDPNKNRGNFQDLFSCDAIYICVPTPTDSAGRCDVTILEKLLNDLKNYEGVIISKCTAPPLEYQRLNQQYKNLVHIPEFLTSANAYQDYINSEFIFIGGSNRIYREFAEKIVVQSQPNIKRVIHCAIEEASLAKYIINSFLATKVIFMNEMYELCQSMNLDYEKISKMISLDDRIGKTHLTVPGNDHQFGFGGKCFPKDTQALLTFANELEITLNVLDAAVKKNLLLRLTNSK